MNYDSALSILKSSFAGGGEGGFYISRLRQIHGRQIDWLDIGIGKDARSIQPFIDCLVAGGNTMRIVGIDPAAEQGSRDNGDDLSIEIVNERFERYVPDRLFDVINADQSLYYVDDIDSQLQRIAGALEPGGSFFVTCWSKDCVLYRLHTSMFENRSTSVTGEDLIALIQSLELFDNVESERFEATVDLGKWRTSPELLCAAVHVIARRELDEDLAVTLTKSLERALSDWGDVEPRVNIAFVARRSLTAP